MAADDGGWGPPSGREPGGETEVELGARPSRWWAVAAVVGVVGLLVAGALTVGRGQTRATDTTTTSSSSTVAPSTSRPPATTARPTTTSTVPARTTIAGAPFVEVASPPGLVLYAVGRGLDRLWRIDLLTGDTTTRGIGNVLALVSNGGGAVDLFPRAGGVVLRTGDGPALFVPDDPAAAAVVLQPDPVGTRVLAHADPSLLWRIDERSGRASAQAIDLAGTPAGPAVEVPAGTVVADDGTGRLVVSFSGGTYVLAGDGTSSMLSRGHPVALGADRVVEVECDGVQVACELVARRRDDGTVTARAPASTPFLDGDRVAVSPSGRHLAAVDVAQPALDRVDLDGARSSRADLGTAGVGPLWWADEDLLCAVQGDGHVRCWRERLGSFLLPDLVPGGVAAMALARP